MRRLVLLAGVLAAPVLPALVATPASAVDNVICVLPASVGCDQTVATIPLAVLAANNNTVDDTILLGATSYSGLPIAIDGSAHAVTLKGAGQGSTTITLPPSTPQTYVNATHATVRDLTISMSTVTSNQDYGLVLNAGSVADHVTVDGAGTANAIAIYAGQSTVTNSVAVTTPTAAAGGRGIFSSGGNTISDTTISGTQALDLSDPGSTDNVSRVHIRSDYNGVVTDGGTINIDDAVIDLGTSANSVGLVAANFNNSTSLKTITADHVTIVGGGAGSRGAWVYAAAAGALQTATLNLTNSIVRGPATSLVADASNDGSQGGASTATLNLSYTDYQTTGGTIDTAGGTGAGGIVQGAGNLVNIDPGFVSDSDQHLTVGSPVVDKGNPAAGGPALDLDGAARVVDGDGDGVAVRDLGAYELLDSIAPDTTIDSGPSGLTNDSTPTFGFSSEAGATFECKVDAGVFDACTSPFTTPALVDGQHTLSVRATDSAANTDASPATRGFTVDTVGPDTAIGSGPSELTNDSTPTFAFSSEAGATFECKVDNATYAACTSPSTTPTLAEGSHTFTVRAKDAAGNTDATPATRAITVDTSGPDTTITRKPARRVTKKAVKIAFSSEAGATFECQVDGKAWKPCTSPIKVRLKLGKHTILVRATDALGNVDATPAKVKVKRIPKP